MRSFLGKLWRFLRLAAIAALVVGVVRKVMGRNQPEVTGEASWPPLVDEPEADATSAPRTLVAQAPTEPEPETEESEPSEPEPETAEAEADWVEPVDGECPASHPVKGNAQSKIFHVPGGASYGRTVAERCYISAEAAEADGFRAAKR